MNYEEDKYKEDLKSAKGWLAIAKENNNNLAIQILEKLFPELRESEGERIRKAIGYAISQSTHSDGTLINGVSSEEALTWLEKQGEQKSKTNFLKFRIGDKVTNGEDTYTINFIGKDCYWVKEHDCATIPFEYQHHWKLVEQNHTDKVEPKFKVGDWILIDRPCRIELIDDNGDYVIQYYDSGTKSVFSKKFCETHFHLWTIQDAKDGDVLVTDSGRPFIFKGFLDEKHPNSPVSYCGIDSTNYFFGCNGNEWWTDENVYPAIEEQLNILFKKMKEAGYEWDAEKKELKKIEQKTSWSEEDDYAIEKLFCLLDTEQDNYPQLSCGFQEIEGIKDWLKSLKPHWKPSEEQMIALRWVLNNIPYNKHKEVISQMVEQLKKL